VVETDLGEFIVQIDHDKPSHLVAPIVHKDKASIAKLFSEYFGTPYNDDPNALCNQARAYLRDKFRKSDLGITGGNFLVAETGLVCSVENEGNQRQSVSTPRVMIALVGIEKVVPRMADLAVMLKAADPQRDRGPDHDLQQPVRRPPRPRREGRAGGVPPRAGRQRPDEDPGQRGVPRDAPVHPVRGVPERLPDLPQDRRPRVRQRVPRADRRADHAADAGPGQPQGPAAGQLVVRGVLRGVPGQDQHPQAPGQPAAGHRPHRRNGFLERVIYKTWAWGMKSPFVYGVVGNLQKWELRRRAGGTGWVRKLPPPGGGWTQVRDMPCPG
jgi:hypothetical protein